jgi:hypothetical protein
MTEPDFDAYLNLLSKLLRLTRGQQAEITSELRDHLEERFADLLSQGHPRDAAIRLALDELGDTAVLAGEFAPSLQVRRRRTIMRYTILSASAVAVTFVVASLFGPAGPEQGANSVVVRAQDQPADAKVKPNAELKPLTEEDLRRLIEGKLARRDIQIDFNEMPLGEALAWMGDLLDLDFLLDRKYLEECEITVDQPVTLKTREGALSVRTALEIVLHQVSGNQLTFAIRDGVVMITGPEADYENEVYDCRDLIAGVQVEMRVGGPGAPLGTGMGGMGGGGGGFFQIGPLTHAAMGQFGGGGVGGVGGGTAPAGGAEAGQGGTAPVIVCPLGNATSRAGQALIGVIQAATKPEMWEESDGEGGTITEYDGLVVIHHSQRVHRKVEELLKKLREARGKQQPARSGQPGLMMPGGGTQPGIGNSGAFPGGGAGGFPGAPPVRPADRDEAAPSKPGKPRF